MRLKCDWCGREFERKPAKIKKHNYCCRSCLGQANGARFRKKHPQVCNNCGKEFDRVNKHGDRNKHFFCSQECAWKYKSKKISVKCEWCGKTFLKKRSDVARTSHNFCSHDCCWDYINLVKEAGADQIVAGERMYRYIAGVKIGRPLTPGEEVHHIDGNHSNNSPDNLMVVSQREHSSIHAAMKERDEYGRFIKKN